MQGSEEPSYSITSSAMASMVWQVANSLSHVASPMKYAASMARPMAGNFRSCNPDNRSWSPPLVYQ